VKKVHLLGIIGSPEPSMVRLTGKEIRPPANTWRKKGEMGSHGEWRIGQREEFLHQRERLKAAVKPYLGGEFIG
jgi:hypothetical protein